MGDGSEVIGFEEAAEVPDDAWNILGRMETAKNWMDRYITAVLGIERRIIEEGNHKERLKLIFRLGEIGGAVWGAAFLKRYFLRKIEKFG